VAVHALEVNERTVASDLPFPVRGLTSGC
jgi:hypothetical protein